MKSISCLAALAALVPTLSAQAASPTDQAFVAKVSQGGLFEVEAGRVAANRASAQDVRDFGVMEAHDHTGVGDKLKAAAAQEGIPVPANLNADFAGKLAQLKSLSGPAFDQAYMQDMASVHAGDGAAFAQEAKAGGTAQFRAFAAETHRIVQRHIGAIDAAAPPAR